MLLSRLMRVCYPHELHVSCVGISHRKKKKTTVVKQCSRLVLPNFYNSAGCTETLSKISGLLRVVGVLQNQKRLGFLLLAVK